MVLCQRSFKAQSCLFIQQNSIYIDDIPVQIGPCVAKTTIRLGCNFYVYILEDWQDNGSCSC